MSDVFLNASNTRNTFFIHNEAGWDKSHDMEILYLRHIDRFFSILAGGNITDEGSRGVLGVRYLLPLNIEGKVWVDTEKELRISLEKKIQITDRFNLSGQIEYDTGTKSEWVAGGEWTINKWLSLTVRRHSDYGSGAGVMIRF
jgi:hypothetical protein